MKILVYGNSGSGKSTLAKSLAERHALAHLDLDRIVWEPGQIAVARPDEAIGHRPSPHPCRLFSTATTHG